MRDIDDVLHILAIDLLGVIPEDSQILLATDRGIPAVHNPAIRSGVAYHNVAKRILGQNVPLMRFHRRSRLMSVIFRLIGRK